MSNSDIKPIQINPALFTMKSKSSKNKTVKNYKSSSDIKPNRLKKDLITKIKNYRHNKFEDKSNAADQELGVNKFIIKRSDSISTAPSHTTPHIIPPMKVTNRRKEITNKKNDITNDDDDFSQSINFLRELSSKNKRKTSKHSGNFPVALGNLEIEEKASTLEKPSYGCLKNGSLPTYREWKNKTVKKSFDENKKMHNEEMRNEEMHNEEMNVKMYEEMRNEVTTDLNMQQSPQFQQSIKPSKKTTTLKYYLGKRGRKVAILIKNSATRKKVSDEHTLLKQTRISDMKNYLKRHNLLKSGSHAPPEVIKKLYEQSLLGGDIRNSNKNNIIHNYLTE